MTGTKAISSAAVGALLALLVFVACDGDDGTGPSGTGAIRVTSSTTGIDVDPDGYTAQSGGESHALAANASTVFDDREPGDHGVELTGVAANCAVANNPRTVTVVADQTVETTFDVACVLLAGDIEVTVAATGADIDPDYTVDVGSQSRAVGANEAVTFADLPSGDHSIELGGVRANCAVVGTNPQVVTVSFDVTSTVTFQVTCAAALVNEIAYDTDRDGNFEVYARNAEGPEVTRLTDDAAADAGPAVSADGTKILFTSGRDDPNGDIYVMNADGSGVTRLTTSAAVDLFGRWSPDGSQILFTSDRDDPNLDVYVMNADGSGVTRLTTSDSLDAFATWSPDGSRIAFTSGRDGNREVYLMDPDGSNLVNLTNDPADDSWASWSPDGSRILFYTHRDGNNEVYVMDVDGSNPVRLTDDPGDDWFPSWSPDGSRIAFQTNRDGDSEIYIMNADGSGATNLTNHPANDRLPSWSPLK